MVTILMTLGHPIYSIDRRLIFRTNDRRLLRVGVGVRARVRETTLQYQTKQQYLFECGRMATTVGPWYNLSTDL